MDTNDDVDNDHNKSTKMMLILMIRLQRTSRSIQFGDDDGVAEDHEQAGEEKEKYIHQAVVHLVMMVVMILVMVVMVMVVMMMMKEEDNEENTNMMLTFLAVWTLTEAPELGSQNSLTSEFI